MTTRELSAALGDLGYDLPAGVLNTWHKRRVHHIHRWVLRVALGVRGGRPPMAPYDLEPFKVGERSACEDTGLAEKVLRNAGIRPEEMAVFRDDLVVYTTPGGGNRYPLRAMRVGQHFFVPCGARNLTKLQNSVSSSTCYAQRTTGRWFTQKRYHNGIRVWRIA